MEDIFKDQERHNSLGYLQYIGFALNVSIAVFASFILKIACSQVDYVVWFEFFSLQWNCSL